jgi:hypothetical protein
MPLKVGEIIKLMETDGWFSLRPNEVSFVLVAGGGSLFISTFRESADGAVTRCPDGKLPGAGRRSRW